MMLQFTHIWDVSTKKKEIFTFADDLPDELAIHIALIINPACQVLQTQRRAEDEDETELQRRFNEWQK